MPELFQPVPFEAAVANVANKGPIAREVFDALAPELRAVAFVVSQVEDLDVVQRVRDLTAGLPAGGDWEEAKAAIAAELSPWLGDDDAAERRAELLLRSHGFAAYSAANYRSLEESKDLFPYRKYQTAQDERVRGAHGALDGIVLPADSPFWKSHTPPWEFGCRCDVVGITEENAAEIRKEDRGKDATRKRLFETGTPELRQIEQAGQLARGNVVYDVTPSGDFTSSAGGASFVELEALRERYDATVFSQFESWARSARVDELGASVWEWLSDSTGGLRKR